MITESIDLFVVETSDPAERYKTSYSTWSWDEARPLEVVVTFDSCKSWTFAAEIVIAGLVAEAGVMDVKLWPSGEAHNRLRLESHEGWAVLEMEREPLAYFVKAMSSVVPQQREIADSEIRHYLDEWSAP